MTRSVATSLGAAVKLGQFILEIISPSETEYFSELYAWNRRAPKIRFFRHIRRHAENTQL